MAFQDAINNLSSTVHRDTVAAPLLESIAQPLRDSLQLYPWAINAEKLDLLKKFGISVSGLGHQAHPHPFHKIIETHLLFQHWSHNCREDSTVLFMKPEKFQKLASFNPHFKHLLNYRLHAKDTTRYPETACSLPTTSTVFMHDALMYYKPSQIMDLFLRIPNLNNLYASVVVPAESSFTDHSLYPEVYQYKTIRSHLHYVPESNHSSAYNQPADALLWLELSTIQGPSFSLTVTRLDSWGPCHSLLIQRGIPPAHVVNDFVSFDVPAAVLLPEATSIRQPTRHRLVPQSVYNALFTYTRAVRTLRISDPVGFVRTQSNKPEHAWVTSSAWDNLQHFSLLTASNRPSNSYSWNGSLWQRFISRLQTVVAELKSSAIFTSSITTFLFSLLFQYFRRKSATSRSLPSDLGFRNLDEHVKLHEGLLQAGFSYTHTSQTRQGPRDFYHRAAERFKFMSALVRSISLSLPLLAFAIYSKCTQPMPPQSLHDSYHNYHHPSKWVLGWSRRLTVVTPEAFLPFEPVPIPADQLPPQWTPAPLQSLLISPQMRNSSGAGSTASFTATDITITITASAFSPATPTPLKGCPLSAPITCLTSVEQRTLANTKPLILMTKRRRRSRTLAPSRARLRTQGCACSARGALKVLQPATAKKADPAPQKTRRINTYSLMGADQVYPSMSMVTSSQSPTRSCPRKSASLWSTHRLWAVRLRTLYPANYIGTSADFLTRLRNGPPSRVPIPVNQSCLLVAISKATSISLEELWKTLAALLPDSLLLPEDITTRGLSTDHFVVLASAHSLKCIFISGALELELGLHNAHHSFTIKHTSSANQLPHFELVADGTRALRGAASDTKELNRAALGFKFKNAFLPFRKVHVSTEPDRAKNLISNMKNGFDGVLANIDPNHPHEARDRLLALDGSIEVHAPRKVSLIHLAGFPGCGKTKPIQALLKTSLFADYKVAVPTVELRAEWKADLALKTGQAWRLSTWESSLLKTASILVIDEVYKMPRGYVDLAVAADPTVRFVILLGDPLQGEYHSSHPESQNKRLSSEIHRLLKYIDCYCLWSHRIPQCVARCFGVESSNEHEGYVGFSSFIAPQDITLACSQSSAKTLRDAGYPATTVSSSQGSTYRTPINLLLDRNSRRLSSAVSLVAATRSTMAINMTGDRDVLQQGPHNNPVFSALYNANLISLHSLFPTLFAKLPIIRTAITSRRGMLTGGNTFGEDDVIIDSRRPGPLNAPEVDDAFLPTWRRPLHRNLASAVHSNCPAQSTHVSPATITAVYPGESFENLAAHFLPAHDPEIKEILHRGEFSAQFPILLNQDFSLSAQSSTLIAAKHDSKRDPTLLVASITKRLRFRPSDSSYQLSSKDQILGLTLYHSWCRAYNRHPQAVVPFDELLFAECININEFAQLSNKTKSTIIANASRSDPDWRITAVKIFSKTQHKINEASIFGSWKACQTLALMHDYVVLFLGPVKKYQRIFDSQERPANVYYHAGHSPLEMSEWAQKHLRSGISHTNDYTAFDQSQHGEAVVFEMAKMRRLSIPESLINLHSYLKRNVDTQFGPLTCMRLTGEPGTYDDNTDYNLAVIYSKYLVLDHPIMVSGDDSVIGGNPTVSRNWPAIEKLLALRFKTESTKHPLFCGYYVGPAGAIRSPVTLFAKIMSAVDDLSIDDKLASYLSEFAIGHSLGHDFWDLLPIDQVPYQSAVYDFFCRHASREQKQILNIGEVPDTVLSSIASHLRFASRALYCLLPSSVRRALTSKKTVTDAFEDPDVSHMQGELLQNFQESNLTKLRGADMSDQVVKQLESNHVDSTPSLIPRPPFQGGSRTVPFQTVAMDVVAAGGNATFNLAGHVSLSEITAPYRKARLAELKAIVCPTAASFQSPITLDLVWSTNNVIFTDLQILQVYGGTRFAIGGPLLSHTYELRADLSYLNPVIKDSVSYVDTPKLTLNASDPTGSGSTATTVATVLVSGKLMFPTHWPHPHPSSRSLIQQCFG
uniref:Replicase-associated protein n=5 Tax=Poinsettia mosaic virus TaxID=113553 RepID=D9N3S0_9VIRU|nr:replicase-associated protein [Poinsettia mosaic virus]